VLRLWTPRGERDVALPAAHLGIQTSRLPAPAAREALRAATALERGGPWRAEGALAPLPGTRREAEAIRTALIGNRLGTQVLLLGEDATRDNLERHSAQARFLHIATHHIADETRGASFSRIALTVPASGNTAGHAFLGLLDVLEGWRGRLAGCELVVLSCCETQRGWQQRDEAIFAMPMGFQFAGAPAVVASLWPVDDQSTADLFADFYARLAGAPGGDKLAAFTEARRALRRKYPEPYFWAPFVYIGDPR